MLFTAKATRNGGSSHLVQPGHAMTDFREKIQPIDLLGERVYRQLMSYLWSGNVRWGETLRESVLAARLGVSRTPVREALTRLAGEGFLENRGRSFAVPRLNEDDIEEIYHLRVLDRKSTRLNSSH